MKIFIKKSLNRVFADIDEPHDRSLIISEKTPFSVKEEYKTLRTNVLFSFPSSGCKVIGVSSAEPLEGKSTNCLNLAITFAQANTRVLLMDCDLRLPSQARLVNLDAIPGISNILVGMNTAEEAIQKTDFSNLHVLLSGNIPPNPSELIGSETMKKLIERLSKDYDYIFVDLPPINIVADTAVMSDYLSGLILVVRAAETKRESIIKALSKLEFANANIIGIILNGVKNNNYFLKKHQNINKYSKYCND
ncbi:MAG: CpsD/CapB family tyrosine-protein kinase [Oscillospiraceae bacterium]|nr:CpsD/CapB family tyrosine-protein kinase [Oscillospiraceae bacterium]